MDGGRIRCGSPENFDGISCQRGGRGEQVQSERKC